MLKASYTVTNEANEQPREERAPFQSPAPHSTTSRYTPGAHTSPSKSELPKQQAPASDQSDRLGPWSWSHSSGSNAHPGNFASNSFDSHEERDASEIGLLDTSFYGVEESGLNDSFLQFETQDLVQSLSLENMQFHVHSSPNRVLQAARGHTAAQQDMPSREEPTGCESDTDCYPVEQEMAALFIGTAPHTPSGVHPTGCVVTEGNDALQ